MVVSESLLLNNKDCWNTVSCFWSFLSFTCATNKLLETELTSLITTSCPVMIYGTTISYKKMMLKQGCWNLLIYTIYLYSLNKEAPFKYGA